MFEEPSKGGAFDCGEVAVDFESRGAKAGHAGENDHGDGKDEHCYG